MKKLVLWFTVALIMGSATAQQSEETPQPGPQMQALIKAYDGQWTITGRTRETTLGPAGRWTGKMTARPILNGFAVKCTYEFKSEGSDDLTHAQTTFWYDSNHRRYAHIHLGDDGRVEPGTGVVDGAWRWENNCTMRDVSYKLRVVDAHAPDGRSFTRKGQFSMDGEKWQPLFSAKFTRVTEGEAETPKPSPEHKKLGILVGDWSYAGRVDPQWQDTQFGQAGNFSGTTSLRFILDGFFVEEHWSETNEAVKRASGALIFGYDAQKGKHTSSCFGSDGTMQDWTYDITDNSMKGNSTITTEDEETYRSRPFGNTHRIGMPLPPCGSSLRTTGRAGRFGQSMREKRLSRHTSNLTNSASGSSSFHPHTKVMRSSSAGYWITGSLRCVRAT